MLIDIKKFDFSYGNLTIFQNLNLTIKQNDFLFISGPTSNGKTTILKILSGIIKTNIKTLEKREIGFVFENPDNYFVADTVKEEILFSLNNLKYPKKDQERKLNDVEKLLEISDLLDLNPHSLSGGEKEIVALASAIINDPKLLLIDGSFSMVDEITKEKIFKVLKKINQEKNITIICTTNNLEDSLFGKRLVIIDKNVLLDKPIKSAFDDEKIFKKCNLELPFMAELSHKLRYYGLVDKIILNMDTMVNKLWK